MLRISVQSCCSRPFLSVLLCAWVLLSGGKVAAKTFEYAGAHVDQGFTQTVVWSISGILDSDIEDAGSSGDTWYYTAPITSGYVSISVNTDFPEFTNGMPVGRKFWVDIPFGAQAIWRSGIDWNYLQGPPPSSASFTHADPYEPGPGQNVIVIESQAVHWFDGPTLIMHFRLVIMDPAVYALGSTRWILGDPYPPKYPPFWYRKPGGCNGCSPMGLPGFTVHPGSLNLVVGDTELSYAAPGPDLKFSRVYNGITGGSGMFGPGWSFEYESSLDTYVAGATHRRGDGRVVVYPVPQSALPTQNVVMGGSGIVWREGGSGFGLTNGFGYSTNWDGTYVSPAGEASRLSVTNANGVWTYRLRDPDTDWTCEYVSTQQLAAAIPLTAIRDDYSNAMRIDYSGGRISRVIDAAGRTNSFLYNASALCTNIRTASGAQLSYGYNGSGRLVRATDMENSVSTYAYDSMGYLTNMSVEGRAWTFLWNTDYYAHVESVIDPLGNLTGYGIYDPNLGSRRVMQQDPGAAITVTDSRYGLVEKIHTPLAHDTLLSYTNGMADTLTAAGGYTRSMGYTPENRLRSVADFDGGLTAIEYSPEGRITAVTNPAGKVWRIRRDEWGGVTNAVTPGGRAFALDRDAAGEVSRLADPAGAAWQFAYDRFGNATQWIDPAGFTNRVSYDTNGLNPISVTDARGRTTLLDFDDNRRLTVVTHPDGSSRRRLFDCCAETASVDESGRTNYVYRDALLAVTQMVDRVGTRYSFRYDSLRNLISAQDAMGCTNRFNYDGDGRLVAVTNGRGRGFGIDRNADGRPTVFWLRPMTPFSFEYDAAGNVRTMQPPDLGTERFFYNVMGELYWRVNGRNQNAFHSYDDDRHRTATTYDSGSFAAWQYDTRGLITNMTDRSGTTRFDWDARHQLSRVTYRDGRQASFSHDVVGLISAVQYPDGFVVSYQRDSGNRVTNMLCGSFSASFKLDAVGRVVEEMYANGAIVRYGRDAEGRVTNISHAVGTTNLLTLGYKRNTYGTVTNLAKSAGLIPYDPVLSVGVVTGAYSDGDAPLQWAGAAVKTDTDGNVTSKLAGVSFGAQYDEESRLLGMSRAGVTNENLYNGLGQRVRAIRNSETNWHHYDIYGRLLFSTGAAGGLEALYFYRDWTLVGAWFAGTGFVVYHFDERGNTLALTDEGGRIAGLYRCTPYGVPAGHYSRVHNPFTFLGRFGVMDEGDGFYAMPGRWYDAAAGRFLQRDPIRFSGGWNLYAYANANPVRFSDVTGLAPVPGLGFSMGDPTFDPQTPIADDCAVLDFDPFDKRPGLFEATRAAVDDIPNKVIPLKGIYDKLRDPRSSWLDVGWELGKDLMGIPGTVIDVLEDGYQWKQKADEVPSANIGGDGGLTPAPSGEEGQY